MTDTGFWHQDILLKQRSGVQTTRSGTKRTAYQMREAINVKGNRRGSNYQTVETRRPTKSGDHQGSTCGDHQNGLDSGHNGVNKNRFTQTKFLVLFRATKCSQSENP